MKYLLALLLCLIGYSALCQDEESNENEELLPPNRIMFLEPSVSIISPQGNFRNKVNHNFLDTGEIADFQGNITSSYVGFNGLYRYYPDVSFYGIEPYFEGALGFKLFNTFERTSAFIDNFEEFNEGEFIHGDLVLAYSGSFGLQTLITENMYANIKSTYQAGNSAEFDRVRDNLVGEDITFPIQAMELTNSATNLLRFDIGVTFIF